jgi:hypothetical protein
MFINIHLLFKIKIRANIFLNLLTFSLYSAELNIRKTESSYSHLQIDSKSDVWLTMHRNSVWIRKTN